MKPRNLTVYTPPEGVAVEIRYDLENAGPLKPFQRLRVRVFAALLGRS